MRLRPPFSLLCLLLAALPSFGDSSSVFRLPSSGDSSLRLLNHWDNLDGTVERGYAGGSIWRWDLLPDSLNPRIEEYAAYVAPLGINGIVLNNVNASLEVLSRPWLLKVRRIADALRAHGITTYLSVNFASPMALDSLPTADPLDPMVAAWWQAKADEIYSLIPDFGGFLVKANSEGQPGPMDFGRTHADGANMLARALAPHHGVVMWRAFVYSPADPDRAKQAYEEFLPLDSLFDSNVILQIKNGPIDFQPREPYSPLFTALRHTRVMPEFQITQEYLGQGNYLVFLPTMWREFLDSVGSIPFAGFAGVANVGDTCTLTGNPLLHANLYGFCRMASDPTLAPQTIAREWLSLSAPSIPEAVADTIARMLCATREAAVRYMMPLGLHHLFAFGHHYGPEPWCNPEGARADWLPAYYHRGDSLGIGFDRTRASGSGATAQYPSALAGLFESPDSCPPEYLLWFHHLPWTHVMPSGRSLWQELCAAYQQGCHDVASFQRQWLQAQPYLPPYLFQAGMQSLNTQYKDALWWRDACLLYFHSLNHLPLPQLEPPLQHTLPQLKAIQLPITNFESPSPALMDSMR